MRNLVKRVNGKTPPFFKKVKRIGLTLAAVSVALMASPIALPAVVVTAAGYMATAGGVIAAISQLTVEGQD